MIAMKHTCPQCRVCFETSASKFNRAARSEVPLYCGRACAGLARRRKDKPTEAERKEAKRLYDAARRAQKGNEIRRKKMEHYYANHERIKAEQAIYRAKRMPKHVEYCRQPEYRAWKVEYDKRYSARKKFGPFAEAALLLRDIENEIAERATKYEIGITNGTINKAQTRRRAL